jgi:hypothetical protein
LISDAYTAAIKGFSLEEMLQAGSDKERVKDIMSLVPFIGRYRDFKAITRMGVTIRPSDLDFDKGLIFAWISEGENGARSN